MNYQAARAALAVTGSWQKSSYSQAQNDCIEIATNLPGWVGVRDSKFGSSSPVLAITLPQWGATLAAAQANEFS